MYDAIKPRLRAGGILLQWFPENNDVTATAVARTLMQAFPHVVAYRSIGDYGMYYLASLQPIPDISVDTFVSRMPEKARQDLVEWGPQPTPDGMAATLLHGRLAMSDLVPDALHGPIITDDRPYNEYFLVRSMFANLNAP